MDRLLLPYLVPGLRRLIYLDVDLVVLDDLGLLWASETGPAGLAARPLVHPNWSPLHRLAETIASRAGSTGAADLVRRSAAAGVNLLAETFNAGVVVMDLPTLRERRFSETTLGWARRFALNDNEAMAIWANGLFARLGERWNYLPGVEHQDDPALIHWAGPRKPWRRAEHVRERAAWVRFARAAARRRPAPRRRSPD
jgi:lipopolysaccharide biosynthesis glycosyltransferase